MLKITRPKTVARSRPPLLWNEKYNEPAIQQCSINGWEVSYNPDDERFYIHLPDEDSTVVCTYASNNKGWDNLKYWCRHHNPQERI